MLSRLLHKIRNREGRFGRICHDLAKRILSLNVPPVRFVYSPLYAVRMAIGRGGLLCWQKIINEPMFKTRCETVGTRLRIDRGFPAISPHLRLRCGDNVHIDGKNTFAAGSVYPDPLLEIGDNSYIGYGSSVSVAQHVRIGRDCLIAAQVLIGDYNGHPLEPERRHEKITEAEVSPVIIEDNVWIGTGAFVGKGVRIGSGAVVAANAVVVRDVAPRTVVAGNPAKEVKRL